MKTLTERQADRVSRKADNCVAVGLKFDKGRGQIGELDRRYVLDEEADAIDAATDAAISDVASVIGAVEPRNSTGMFKPAFPHKVKLSGV